MSNLVSKKAEMNYFLKYLAELSENGIDVDSDVVYNTMESYGVRSSDNVDGILTNIKPELFPKWKENFLNDPDIHVFVAPNWRYFCQFISNERIPGDEYIKMYIPIDGEHIYKGAIDLFNYVESLGVRHESKISSEIRSDDIIIRLDGENMDSAKKIINYVNSNEYIREGLTRVNPFVPVVNGIGIMKESGISYNNTMAKLIAYHIKEMQKQQKDVSIYSFQEWLNSIQSDYRKSPINVDDFREVKSIFDQSIYEENILLGNRREQPKQQESTMTLEQKNHLFLDTIFATYDKYGSTQAKEAIMHAISGDFSGFTNGKDDQIKYRNELKKNVSKEEIKYFVDTSVKIISGKNADNIRDDISQYVTTLFKNRMANNLDEICAVTIENHDEEQLDSALNEYIKNGNVKGFSRFSNGDKEVNYRKKVGEYSKEDLIKSMNFSLALKGINANGLDEEKMIKVYSSILSKSFYNSSGGISYK